MINILFVCHGNICRSTMAEFVMKDLLQKEGKDCLFYIESAGTSTEELGNDTHPGTRKKLIENHIPFAKRKARQVTPADYDRFHYIIGMDDANVKNLLQVTGGDAEQKICKFLDFAGEDRSIADPWYTGNFDETYIDIVTGCKALMETLCNHGNRID